MPVILRRPPLLSAPLHTQGMGVVETDEARSVRGVERQRIIEPVRLGLGRRHALDAMYARFEFQLGEDAAPGECVILLNYQHQNADTPYRQQGPIFVRETHEKFDAANVIAPTLRRRTLSLRGYDSADMMVAADLTEGADARRLIERFLGEPDVADWTYDESHWRSLPALNGAA